jgi:hypothetical protein
MKYFPEVNCYLFSIDPIDYPVWFGAACWSRASQFDKVNLFFHPLPTKRDGYDDADYPDQGAWPNLYRYMEFLGLQLAACASQQLLIMPYFPLNLITSGSLGIFPGNWRDIVEAIAGLIKVDIRGGSAGPVSVSDLVVSSFSAGIIPAHAFRTKAASSIAPVLREVWDFDGYYYPPARPDATNLTPTPTVKVIQYSQLTIPGHHAFYVPPPRWKSFSLRKPGIHQNEYDVVHSVIPKYLFNHAGSISTVGQ